MEATTEAEGEQTRVCSNCDEKEVMAIAKIPTPPATGATVTDHSVTLPELEGCEYSIDSKTWQESNVFEGLSAETEYTFYYRTAATDEKAASPASTGVTYKTEKAPVSSESSSSSSNGSSSSSSTPNTGESSTWVFVSVVVMLLAAGTLLVLRKKRQMN